jgi:hypothetical protein
MCLVRDCGEPFGTVYHSTGSIQFDRGWRERDGYWSMPTRIRKRVANGRTPSFRRVPSGATSRERRRSYVGPGPLVAFGSRWAFADVSPLLIDLPGVSPATDALPSRLGRGTSSGETTSSACGRSASALC